LLLSFFPSSVSAAVSKWQHLIYIFIIRHHPENTEIVVAKSDNTMPFGGCCTVYNTMESFLHHQMLLPLQSPLLMLPQVHCSVKIWPLKITAI